MDKLNTGYLGEYCQIDSGYAFKSAQFTKNEEDICLVKGSNLGHRKINWADAPRWSSNEFDQLARYQLILDDVVVAMDRPIVGGNLKFAWIQKSDPKALLVQRVARLRGKNGLDQKYLKSVIADPAFKAYIDTITTGVNVPHISGPDMRRYKFPFPPLPTQQKIAHILSAYDDLIENNLKRIKLLEEMAQITYEQWFVRMKFPNHENTAIDSKTGLPEGWKKDYIGNNFKTASGGTPSSRNSEYYDDGVIPWVRTQELRNNLILDTSKKITPLGLKKSSAKLFPEKTVLLAMYGNTIGETGFLMLSASTNQACCAFLTDEANSYYLHQYLMYHKQQVLNYRMGAAQENISQEIIKKIPILIPNKKIILNFEEVLSPIYTLIESLSKQNNSLKEARDILLPRLMTGMIDVDKIKISSLKATTELEQA